MYRSLARPGAAALLAAPVLVLSTAPSCAQTPPAPGAVLGKVATVIASTPGPVVIEGHTDSRGENAHNRRSRSAGRRR